MIGCRFVSAIRVLLPMSVVIGMAAGCERPQSSSSPPRTAPSENTSPSTSGPSLQLCNWVLHPFVDPAEQKLPDIRIVSAAPNVTEICCALGLREALVGRTRYCDYPPGIDSVASIGALVDVNIEALLGLRADLILISGTSRTQVDRLAALALRFESVPDDRLSDLFEAIRRIGELTGRPRTADALCREIEEDLARVTKQYAIAPRARVLLLTATLSDPPRPPFVAGPGSFYDDLLKRAGHANVVGGEQAAFAPLSLEYIVRTDPDVIIELDPDGSARPNGDADARRAWSKVGPLRAIKARRVRVLSGSQHYVLGPRIAQTYAALCDAIAGESHEQP